MVGNTIKSKKMPEYIAKFLAKGIRLLLQGNGQGFLEEYYNYIEKIYNYKIPLRDIASKGKIKKSLAEYKKDVQTITKAGRPKSRQAWYELAIQNNLAVNNGDTIYYINNGTKKSESDAKKVQHYYLMENTLEGETEVDMTKQFDKEWNKYRKECKDKNIKVEGTKDDFIKKNYPSAWKKDEIIMNCFLVPREIIDKEEDTFCCDVSEELEYNVVKYIDQFNKRITPLLVCFSKEIRSQILIDNPEKRNYFTEEQCRLSSGEPNKISDQDTYEQLMTMEDKEIKFWDTYNLVPPFVEECGMGKWEDILADYHKRMDEEAKLGITEARELYYSLINEMTSEEWDKFNEEGELPDKIFEIVDLDPITGNLVSKKYPDVVIGKISEISQDSEPWGIEGDDE